MNDAQNNSHPQRRRPLHGILEFVGQPTIIFLTVCTKDRVPWLATEAVHRCLRSVWGKATAWLLGRYVIMPDHVHCFAAATGSAITLEAWISYWKSQLSKQLGEPQCRWQSQHWDFRMRNEDSYEEKWNYILHNPIRAGLSETTADWPYQGVIHELRW